MMNFNRPPIFAAALGLLIAQLPGLVSADVTWEFNYANCDSSTGGGCGGSSFADTQTYDADTGNDMPRVTVSAWANTTNSNKDLARGEIVRYGGGLGVRNADWNTNPGDAGEGIDPEHAVDNDQRFDLVLFDFDAAVSLNQISLGYRNTDADISVLAYTGGGTLPLGGLEYTATTQELTTNGWSFIGNYDVDNIDSSNPYRTSISTPIESSYWIVGAYNSAFASYGCEPSSKCQLDPWLDHFKILSVRADGLTPPDAVPAPGTLLLMVGAGLPLLARRRRRQSVAS